MSSSTTHHDSDGRSSAAPKSPATNAPELSAAPESATSEFTHTTGASAGVFAPPPPLAPNHRINSIRVTPRNAIQLQRTIGNTAARNLIQRDIPGSGTTPGQPRRYNINFRPPIGPPVNVSNVSQEEAVRVARRIANTIINYVGAGRESHTYLQGIHEDQWIVAAISDFAGRVSMPPLSIWSVPRNSARLALAQLDSGDVDTALRTLQQAAQQADSAYHQLYLYREGTITGAERSVTVLEVTEVAGAAAATVATGGLATGYLATAGVAAATAGTYGMVQNAAGQGGSMYQGLQGEFNMRAMLQRGAADAVAGFVGALAGGALTRYLQRSAGGFLSRATPELLEELGRMNGLAGPLPRDFFLTTGQRVFSEFLGSVGVTPLTAAVTTVLNRMTGATSRMPGPAEFAEQVWSEMVQGGIMTLFITFLTHNMPASRRPSTTPGESQAAQGARPPSRETVPPVARPGAAPSERAQAGEPSIIIEDPVMAAAARPATSDEAASLNSRPGETRAATPQGRPLEPPNPTLWGQVREMLRGRRWQDVMVQTDAQGAQGQAMGDQMIHYRRSIMEQVQRLFQGEPAGTASTERTSDVDINMMGDNAGQNMQRAHDWLVENVGPDYSNMLRLDLLIDNSRSTTYRQAMGEMPPAAQQAMLSRLNSQAEMLNLARMMQHAEHAQTPTLREQAVQQVRELQSRLGLSAAEIARIQEMAQHPPSAQERNQLFTQIDGLMAQLRAAQDPATRAQLAEQITTLQMRANFHMGEAYISPGAIRQTVQGQSINAAEAYQAALSHLEMFDHAVGQAHGDVNQAARGYELFKYVSRYARAAQSAGINTPETSFFMRLGDYIYRANRGANRQSTSDLSPQASQDFMASQHRDANRHEQSGNTDVPFYVTDTQAAPTDAQLAQMVSQFRDYVNRTLPQMRAAGGTAPAPGGAAPASGTTAAAAAAGGTAAQQLEGQR